MSGKDRAVRATPGSTGKPEQGSNMRGILAMIASCAFFITGDALVKTQVAAVPVGQILAFRGGISVAVLLAVLAWTGNWQRLGLLRSRPIAWRSAMDVGAAHFFFTALIFMPLANASAINQVTPLAVTAGAAVFLAEPVGWRRWLATFAGLVGVLLIIRPGTQSFNWAALLVIGSVLCVAGRDLVTRSMGQAIPTDLVTLATVTAIGVTGLARYPVESWVSLDGPALAALTVAGIVNTIGYFFAVVSMRSGEISAVGPFRYVSILIAVAIGYFFFGERLDAASVAGIAIVIAAGLYTLHREQKLRKAAAA